MRLLPFALLLVIQSVLAVTPAKRFYNTHDYYVLEHDPLTGAPLAEVAGALGVEVVEQAGELANHWLVRVAKGLQKRDADPVLRSLEGLRLEAKSLHSPRSEDTLRRRRVASSVKNVFPQTLRQRVKRAPPPIRPPKNETSEEVALRLGLRDPEFGRQWHLVNDDYPEHMMNVTTLWEEGITGKGVITAFVDDGLDYTSDDLAANFYAYGSYDYNDHTDLPTPVLFDDHHGTRCAGQVAAVKNDVCGVGIAYESKVAGIRILSGPISDIDEAAALNYDYQNTSIYSCSWGPPDDGRSMEGPNHLIKKAMVNGIEQGRGGKGSVFVFASGNGGRNGDQCNFDGYTNSIFSVTVAAIDFKGLHPDYSEACAANMVVAYTSGSSNYITTTDRGKNKCSHSHGGTSAAAPNAAGVFALALQARPDLGWRDIQHLCVRTAWQVSPTDPDWEKTAAGRPYSYKYGFGSLSGVAFVKAAQTWKLVNPQTWIDLPVVQVNNGTMDSSREASGGSPIPADGVESKVTVTKEMLKEHNFATLEHVTVKVWITHTRRGDVEVELVSPNGIKSVLAGRRYGDSATTGFHGWTFMTVKHWDEDPVGEWSIRVSDQRQEDESGVFLGWTMSIWGAVADPEKGHKTYVLPTGDDVLPPPPSNTTGDGTPSSSVAPSSTNTKTLTGPTAYLPGDHGESEGENHKPAFSSSGTAASPTKPAEDVAESASASPSISATPDEGWFPDLGKLTSNKVWFFLAVGAVVLFGIGAGIFFWRRAVVRKRRANYSSLRGEEDVAMSAISRATGGARAPRQTKELYDAFGEVSDDEDADEETALRPHAASHGLDTGLHAGFLDDDDPPSAGGGQKETRYRDEPDSPVDQKENSRSTTPGSGSGSGSSWEHASEAR
ncbi:peptidase S8/S53 domain-containing protein [Ganoderma leucocontextum]|nr:peptidase S8/S53 domain-containing protein [Ganoderma leucocontextum]